MKKGLLLLALLLAACSSQMTIEDQVEIDNTVIALNSDMAGLLDSLPADYQYTAMKSCLYEGNDETYEFDDFVIDTYPDKDLHRVHAISFQDESVVLDNGLKVGDDAARISAVYKEEPASADAHLITYENEQRGIGFYLEDDKISAIELYLKN